MIQALGAKCAAVDPAQPFLVVASMNPGSLLEAGLLWHILTCSRQEEKRD